MRVKKIAVVILSCRPLVLTDLRDVADAVLFAFFPGTEGGHGIADIVCGDANPSGRLVQTFPHAVGQIPISYRERRTWYETKWVDGSTGFSCVKSVGKVRCEKTKDALVLTDIRRDLEIQCDIVGVEPAKVESFDFRYRATGATPQPKAGGQLYYASLGSSFSDARRFLPVGSFTLAMTPRRC